MTKNAPLTQTPLSAPLDEMEAIAAQVIRGALPRTAAWALRTIEALPGNADTAFGWRDFHSSNGWCHPRSNVGERIEVFLWLAERLGDQRFADAARHAGKALLDDPVRGIYQGPEEDGRGMVWYWRDVGVYMTNYTMRIPPALLRLARATGEPRFEAGARLCGEQLLRSQSPAGILRAGWYPSEDGASIPNAVLDRWLPEDRINIRFAHVARAYAELFQATGDTRYESSLERLSGALSQVRLPDGALPQDVRVSVAEPFRSEPKGHFLYYVLNGLAGAKRYYKSDAPFDATLRGLADFVRRRVDHQWSAPFNDQSATSSPIATRQMASADPAYALAHLGDLLGDGRYRAAALQLVIAALLRCPDLPGHPDCHGGLVLHTAGNESKFRIDGHCHFWLLMGIRALEATADPASPLWHADSRDPLVDRSTDGQGHRIAG